MKRNYFRHFTLLVLWCALLFSVSSLRAEAEDSKPVNFSFEEEFIFDTDSAGTEVRYECELLADTKYAEVWLSGIDLEYYYDIYMVSELGATVCQWENVKIKSTRYTGRYFQEPIEAGRYEFIVKCNEADTSSTASGRVEISFCGTYAIRPTELTLSDESIYIMQGRTHQLSATYAPDYANTDTETVWASSNKNVATVDKNGVVTACGAGKAIITATLGELTKSCEITVEKSQGTFSELKAFSGTLEIEERRAILFNVPVKSGISLFLLGEEETGYTYGRVRFCLKKNNNVIWESEECKFDDNNLLYMLPNVFEPGNYILTIEGCSYSSEYEGYILCDTVDFHKATGIKLNKKTKSVAVGKQFYLKGKVTPSYTTTPVKWKSSNKKVATVNQYGLVTTKRMGKAVITVSVDGKKAKCTVYVTKQKLESWTGKTKDLSKKVKNVPGYKKGKWTSSNPSVASVNSKGKVTFRAHGKANITLTAKGKKYVFTVYSYGKDKLKNDVIKKVKSYESQFFPITIKKKKFDNKNFTFTVKFSRYDAFFGHVTYTAIGYYKNGKVKIVDNYNW